MKKACCHFIFGRTASNLPLTGSIATWDSPPGPSDNGWAAYTHAFQRFLDSREVFVRKMDRKQTKEFDNRPKALFERNGIALKTDPDLGQDKSFKLMDFQVCFQCFQ